MEDYPTATGPRGVGCLPATLVVVFMLLVLGGLFAFIVYGFSLFS